MFVRESVYKSQVSGSFRTFVFKLFNHSSKYQRPRSGNLTALPGQDSKTSFRWDSRPSDEVALGGDASGISGRTVRRQKSRTARWSAISAQIMQYFIVSVPTPRPPCALLVTPLNVGSWTFPAAYRPSCLSPYSAGKSYFYWDLNLNTRRCTSNLRANRDRDC